MTEKQMSFKCIFILEITIKTIFTLGTLCSLRIIILTFQIVRKKLTFLIKSVTELREL